MESTAERVIIPPKGVFRIVFLYIGQGESTILAIPDGNNHKIILIDCHIDESFGGINLPFLLKDLKRKIDVFINTHPHNDHLRGIKAVSEAVDIAEIWHSGHIPGKDHGEAYDELKEVIRTLPKDKVKTLQGTRDSQALGNVTYNVLAPAEYVSDEIEDEDPDTRCKRIHEQCAVLRFCYGSPELTCILITGDSDLAAWQNHITDYHKDRLPSAVLSASHHGSRSFFKEKEEDEPYTDHMDAIGANYLVISAPKQDESPHGHPHEDALEVYKEYIDEDSILHLGKNRECVIVDVFEDGGYVVKTDKDLVEVYGSNGDGGGSKSGLAKGTIAGITYTSLDKKPMGE